MVWKICKSIKLILITFTIIPVVQLSTGQHEKSNDYGSENRLKFTYIMNNFRCCHQNVSDVIISPPFSRNGQCKWCLKIYTNGENLETEGYFALYISSIDCNAIASVRFSFLNADPEKTYPQDFVEDFVPSQSSGIVNYLPLTYLLSEESGLLPDDKLTIICEVAIVSDLKNDSGKPTLPVLSIPHLPNVRSPLVTIQLAEDLAFLLDNPDLSDITLITAAGIKIKAHKAILAARSDVFKGMFVNGAEIKPNERLGLPDMDYQVVNEMLRYIYTGEAFQLMTTGKERAKSLFCEIELIVPFVTSIGVVLCNLLILGKNAPCHEILELLNYACREKTCNVARYRISINEIFYLQNLFALKTNTCYNVYAQNQKLM